MMKRPTIVVLCGSTRFSEAYQAANLGETLAGNIVLTIGCDMRSDGNLFADMTDAAREEVKRNLDDLHMRKIDLADEVYVLNCGGYTGPSTRREIAYAKSLGKPIRYLETAARYRAAGAEEPHTAHSGAPLTRRWDCGCIRVQCDVCMEVLREAFCTTHRRAPDQEAPRR